jgi:hypothetical protein
MYSKKKARRGPMNMLTTIDKRTFKNVFGLAENKGTSASSIRLILLCSELLISPNPFA